MADLTRNQQLIRQLTAASDAYYNTSTPILSDFEYDRLYDELVLLEQKTGTVLSNSPTQRVGFEVKSALTKVAHSKRMFSLDKTKEPEKLVSFLGEQKGLLSWKLDGLAIALRYEQGYLKQAVTRGNGEIGEDVTHNAKFFRNIPLQIPFTGTLLVRGEAIIPFTEFTRINNEMELAGEDFYKNPRNLISGTIRQLDSKVAAKRNMMFYAYTVAQADGADFSDSKAEQLRFLQELGFTTAHYEEVTAQTVIDQVAWFKKEIPTNDFATDGLVLTFDGIRYSEGLGETAKFPRDSLAFKWADETQVTKLVQVQWNTSRTGLVNPVAVFEPVELEGTTVTKASVHNVSIIEELELGIGDEIKVYKANMIIPQIAENLTRSNQIEIPKVCPECGGETEIIQNHEQKALYCTNPNCRAQIVKMLAHYTSRDAMNIEGLSVSTLGKFVAAGFIENYADIYNLERFSQQIRGMEGFGERSYQNLIAAIEKSKDVEMANFINALSVNNVGLANAKLLVRHFQYDLERIVAAEPDELLSIDGFGEAIAHHLVSYFQNAQNQKLFWQVVSLLRIKKPAASTQQQILAGKQFVITGDLQHYKHRGELQAEIEGLGGKVTGSVTKKTSYLINNDKDSSSSKNKKAKELGIEMLTEEEYLKLFGQSDRTS